MRKLLQSKKRLSAAEKGVIPLLHLLEQNEEREILESIEVRIPVATYEQLKPRIRP